MPKGLNRFGEMKSVAGSLNELSPPTDTPEGDVIGCLNMRPSRDGISREKRQGYTKFDNFYNFGSQKIRGFFDYWDESGTNRYVVVTDTKIYTRAITDEEWFEIYSQANEIQFPIKPVAYLRERPIIVGFDQNFLIEPSTVYGLGIVGPESAPSTVEGADGNLTGRFKYVVTYMRSGNFQVESNPSPISSRSVGSAHRARAGNIATIGTAAAHSLIVGSEVVIAGMGGTGYNGTWTVASVPDNTHFTCSNTGTDETETADTDGIITYPIIVGRVRSAHRARATNVATIGTSSPHSLAVGNEVVVSGMGGTGYNGTWVVASVPDTTHFTYANTGGNEGETADTDGTISYKKKINLSAIPVSSDPKVDKKRLYRTTADGEVFFWLVDIDNATTDYEDDLTELGDEVSYDRYPPPVSIFAEVWDDRVWFVPKDYRNQVHFTNKGSAEEMAYDNIVQVKGKDSDEIMGIRAYMDSLYVLKHKKPFRIDKVGESSYQMTELPFKTGTDCPASVCVVGGFLMWYSKRGLEIFKEKELVDPPISDLIPITIESINQDAVGKSFGNELEKRNEYWLSVPVGSSTEPNKIVVFDYIRAKLTPFEFAKGLTCMHNIRSGTAELQFITGSSDGNLFIQDSGYTDNGTPIESNFMTKHYRCLTGERGVWNTLRRMWAEYVCPFGSKIVLNIYKNKQRFPVASIELEGMSPTDLDEKRSVVGRLVKLGISCAYFCLEFVHNEEANGTVRILPPEIYFKNKVWKRDIEAD